MADAHFTALAEFLRAPEPSDPAAQNAAPVRDAPFACRAGALDAALCDELPRLRLAALESFESAVARLLATFARDLFARESAASPVDVAALAGRLLAELAAHESLALALSPADAQRVRLALPVRVDPTLQPGDAIVEVRDGAFESRIAFRFEVAIAGALDTTP